MWMIRPSIRNINILVVIVQSIKIMTYYFSSLDISSIELLNMPLLYAGYRLYLVVLTPNCLTLLPASLLLYCKKSDLDIQANNFHFLYVSPFELLFHKVALLVYFPTQDCVNNIFPMPINKLSILWLEREIAISWCTTAYKTFYLLSVSITLFSLDFVQEVVFPVSVMWCICVQHA